MQSQQQTGRPDNRPDNRIELTNDPNKEAASLLEKKSTQSEKEKIQSEHTSIKK